MPFRDLAHQYLHASAIALLTSLFLIWTSTSGLASDVTDRHRFNNQGQDPDEKHKDFLRVPLAMSNQTLANQLEKEKEQYMFPAPAWGTPPVPKPSVVQTAGSGWFGDEPKDDFKRKPFAPAVFPQSGFLAEISLPGWWFTLHDQNAVPEEDDNPVVSVQPGSSSQSNLSLRLSQAQWRDFDTSFTTTFRGWSDFIQWLKSQLTEKQIMANRLLDYLSGASELSAEHDALTTAIARQLNNILQQPDEQPSSAESAEIVFIKAANGKEREAGTSGSNGSKQSAENKSTDSHQKSGGTAGKKTSGDASDSSDDEGDREDDTPSPKKIKIDGVTIDASLFAHCKELIRKAIVNKTPEEIETVKMKLSEQGVSGQDVKSFIEKEVTDAFREMIAIYEDPSNTDSNSDDLFKSSIVKALLSSHGLDKYELLYKYDRAAQWLQSKKAAYPAIDFVSSIPDDIAKLYIHYWVNLIYERLQVRFLQNRCILSQEHMLIRHTHLSNDGKILFVVNEKGIYTADLSNDCSESSPLKELYSGEISSPVFSSDDKHLLFQDIQTGKVYIFSRTGEQDWDHYAVESDAITDAMEEKLLSFHFAIDNSVLFVTHKKIYIWTAIPSNAEATLPGQSSWGEVQKISLSSSSRHATSLVSPDLRTLVVCDNKSVSFFSFDSPTSHKKTTVALGTQPITVAFTANSRHLFLQEKEQLKWFSKDKHWELSGEFRQDGDVRSFVLDSISQSAATVCNEEVFFYSCNDDVWEQDSIYSSRDFFAKNCVFSPCGQFIAIEGMDSQHKEQNFGVVVARGHHIFVNGEYISRFNHWSESCQRLIAESTRKAWQGEQAINYQALSCFSVSKDAEQTCFMALLGDKGRLSIHRFDSDLKYWIQVGSIETSLAPNAVDGTEANDITLFFDHTGTHLFIKTLSEIHQYSLNEAGTDKDETTLLMLNLLKHPAGRKK